DAGEGPIAGVTTFLDANNNGILDMGEATTTTDASGNFTFSNLLPGTYKPREVVPAGYRRTTALPADIMLAAAQNVTGVLFGNHQPGIHIVKTASPMTIFEGGVGSQSVTYTYTVTNNTPSGAGSSDPLTITSIIDDNGTGGTGDDFTPTFVGGDTNSNG